MRKTVVTKAQSEFTTRQGLTMLAIVLAIATAPSSWVIPTKSTQAPGEATLLCNQPGNERSRR